MSKYATHRVLWLTAADGELAQQLREAPDSVLAEHDLSAEERTALATQDVRALFQLGVHPFLLYNFALRMAGGFSIPFMQAYLGQLEGLSLGDLET